MYKNKICAVMTAIAMMLCMAGCSGSQQDAALPTEPAGATMTVALSHSQITSIVSEEAGKYFAGDCTAENAAKAIQGRVGMYLSEQG